MLRHLLAGAALFCAVPAATSNPADILTGTFSNEEQVYFDKDAGNTPRAWFSMKISPTEDGAMIEEIDAFGVSHSDGHAIKIKQKGTQTVLDYGKCQRLYLAESDALIANGVRGECAAPATMTRIGAEGVTLTYPDGKTTLLRRARAVTCWSAIPKSNKKPDGTDDWHFAQGIKIHDQGGRALIGKDVADVKPLVIRMRNVVWPDGNSNRPSLVLYIHNPDEPDKALSYVWADPGAARIGINLRWMQASCTIDGAQ